MLPHRTVLFVLDELLICYSSMLVMSFCGGRCRTASRSPMTMIKQPILAYALAHPGFARYLSFTLASSTFENLANLEFVTLLEAIVNEKCKPHIMVRSKEGRGYHAVELTWTLAMGGNYKHGGRDVRIQVDVPLQDNYDETMTVLQFLTSGKKGTSWRVGLVTELRRGLTPTALQATASSLYHLRKYSLVLHFNPESSHRPRLDRILRCKSLAHLKQNPVLKIWNLISTGKGESPEMGDLLDEIESQLTNEMEIQENFHSSFGKVCLSKVNQGIASALLDREVDNAEESETNEPDQGSETPMEAIVAAPFSLKRKCCAQMAEQLDRLTRDLDGAPKAVWEALTDEPVYKRRLRVLEEQEKQQNIIVGHQEGLSIDSVLAYPFRFGTVKFILPPSAGMEILSSFVAPATDRSSLCSPIEIPLISTPKSSGVADGSLWTLLNKTIPPTEIRVNMRWGGHDDQIKLRVFTLRPHPSNQGKLVFYGVRAQPQPHPVE